MKGFIHLIEVAVAAVLITIVIATFFSVQDIKENWSHADLLALGNSIGFSTEASGSIPALFDRNQRSLEMNETKPDNIGYSIQFEGAPKEIINVGCIAPNCIYVHNWLSARTSTGSSYLNGRWISFNVTDGVNLNGDLSSYDALVLVDFAGYSTYETQLTSFINNGKVVVAVNQSIYPNDAFYRMFGLSSSAPGAVTVTNFTQYNPSDDKTSKYFLGMGFDIDVIGDSYLKYGKWNIWGNERDVTANSTHVRIENITETSEIVVREGNSFILNGPTSQQKFTLKKNMFDQSIVIIQPTNSSFDFPNSFCDGNVITNTAKKIVSSGNCSAVTVNGTAVWISHYYTNPYQSEYGLLLKSSLASKADNWQARPYVVGRDRSSSAYFTSLCCDVPEPVEIDFILWYVY